MADRRPFSILLTLNFQDAASPENLQFFYSNGAAILSGFHENPQNISVEFTDVIN